jgi:DNA mismatch repair protein MutL
VTVLGVVANLYVVAVDAEGLILVDQHAAHERVLYEQVMGRLDRGAAPSQRLLLPQTVELPPRDAAELRAQIPILERMGFGIAEFGDRSFIVDALPPFLGVEAVPQLLRSLVDDLGGSGSGVNRARFAEEIVAKNVCRHAVKANDALRAEELARLIRDLRACANPLTCPHGRPTMLRLSLAELERRFGRRPS